LAHIACSDVFPTDFPTTKPFVTRQSDAAFPKQVGKMGGTSSVFRKTKKDQKPKPNVTPLSNPAHVTEEQSNNPVSKSLRKSRVHLYFGSNGGTAEQFSHNFKSTLLSKGNQCLLHEDDYHVLI
jgi:hypothetical protein